MSERRFGALRHPHFALYWAAQLVSRIGTQMRDVALAWHIYLLTRSPLALGLLGAARVLPTVVLALGGGVAADAFDRRRVMLITQSIMALTSAAMALTTRQGSVNVAILYGLVGAASAASAFDNPARQALAVNLLPKEDLANGLTLMIFGWQAATVVGPAVGGALIAATSLQAIYALDAASFFAVIAALLVIRPRTAGAGEPGRSDVSLRAALEALRYLRKRPILMWLMGIDFLGTFFAGSLLLLPIFAVETFAAGARGLGMLTAAPAVGALVTSAYLSWRPPIARVGLAVICAVVAYGVCVTGFGVAGSFPLALGLLAGSGAADTVSTVVRQVVRQTMTPDALRGRMGAINMIFFVSGPQLGEVEAGAVAELAGARFSVVSGGLACILVALAVAASAPALRALRAESATLE